MKYQGTHLCVPVLLLTLGREPWQFLLLILIAGFVISAHCVTDRQALDLISIHSCSLNLYALLCIMHFPFNIVINKLLFSMLPLCLLCFCLNSRFQAWFYCGITATCVMCFHWEPLAISPRVQLPLNSQSCFCQVALNIHFWDDATDSVQVRYACLKILAFCFYELSEHEI